MSATDAARAVLSDPRAPADEKFDAQAEMEAQHRPTAASDLIPQAAFLPVIEAIRSGEIGDELAKAGGSVLPFPAPARGRGTRAAPRGMRSVRLDESRAVMAGDEYVDKPGAIDFDGLRAMVEGTPILSAVIATRIRQMMRFCNPSEDGGPGYEIRHIDKDHKASKAEKEQMALLTRFLRNGGWEFSARKRKALKRDTFPAFMAKLLRDSLTMDAAPFETEVTRSGKSIDGLYAIDGSSVRLCSEEGYQGDDEIFAIQVVAGKVATLYDYSQLVYEVRNPRTDMALAGYGQGETEILIRTVTYLLQTVNFNADFFDKNSVPKGLLQIFGDFGKEDLAHFRRHWSQMVQGSQNRHALPVLVSKDQQSGATYTDFNAQMNEMAFGKWITFLTSVVCAVYSIDPAEIGFESFAAAKSSLSGQDTSEKLASSRDKGFRPLSSHFEAVLTDFVVADFNPDWCFRFAGLEEEDKARAWEARKLTCTVDEIRAEEGYAPFPDPTIGALPVNPALIQPALALANPDPAVGDFGADPMAPQEEKEPGDDFGADPPSPGEKPEKPGDDFGADAPPATPKEKPGNDFGKALRMSALWRLGRFQ